MEVLTDKR